MADIAQRIGLGLGGVLDQPLVRIGLMTLAVSVAIAWILTAFWCFRDMRNRTHDLLAPYVGSGMILISSPLLFPLTLGLYLLVRPRESTHEREVRLLARTALAMAEAEVSCPRCRSWVDRRWAWCPTCAAALGRTCAACGGGLESAWSICPWCASDVRWAKSPGAAAPVPSAADLVAGGHHVWPTPEATPLWADMAGPEDGEMPPGVPAVSAATTAWAGDPMRADAAVSAFEAPAPVEQAVAMGPGRAVVANTPAGQIDGALPRA